MTEEESKSDAIWITCTCISQSRDLFTISSSCVVSYSFFLSSDYQEFAVSSLPFSSPLKKKKSILAIRFYTSSYCCRDKPGFSSNHDSRRSVENWKNRLVIWKKGFLLHPVWRNIIFVRIFFLDHFHSWLFECGIGPSRYFAIILWALVLQYSILCCSSVRRSEY